MIRTFMNRLCVSFAMLLFGLAFALHGAEVPPQLTLERAHELALKNHPRIRVADLAALAARQAAREARSAYFPNLFANMMSVGTSEDNTRLAAVGGLNNPAIFDRNAEGLILSQLITDFGRTANLAGSANLEARAEENNAQATREQILLAVDNAFFAAEQALAVTQVARQTIATRQLFLEQVTALASNKLRSELDVSFAQVNVQDAQILLSKSQNDLDAAFAQLSDLLGLRTPAQFQLVVPPLRPEVSTNVSDFVQRALVLRPDLLRLRNQREADLKYARAQWDARLPAISAIGAAGVVPIHDPELPDYYAAAGVSVSVPLFAGGFYAARQHEAELRAQAAAESLRDAENNVIRDVRIAWLNTRNAYERLGITQKLLENAQKSLDLAKARYKNGISSIVEFNQAELNFVSAQITYAETQYECQVQRSALAYQTGSLH